MVEIDGDVAVRLVAQDCVDHPIKDAMLAPDGPVVPVGVSPGARLEKRHHLKRVGVQGGVRPVLDTAQRPPPTANRPPIGATV